MKTGNPKQAAILGIVAVGAVGFLGSSLFSTFASGSTPSSAVQETVKPADPATQPAAEPGDDTPATIKLPANEPDDSGNNEFESDLPPKIKKTPFGKPGAKKPTNKATDKTQPQSLAKGGKKVSEGDPETRPIDPTWKENPGLPSTDEMPAGGIGSDSKDPDKDQPKPIMIRFEGFIDAGHPVAIIRIGDSQYTADQGEGLPYGIRVIAMTSEKLTLSIRGRRKSVWIGREVQL